MNCSKAERWLQAYIDGQLTLEQIRTLEHHLAQCTSCRENLVWFEEMTETLRQIDIVIEPVDLAEKVMQRVAYSTQRVETVEKPQPFSLFFPSMGEILTIISLATITMIGITLEQPQWRAHLPIFNGRDVISLFVINMWNTFTTVDGQTFMAMLWIVGALLGIWITLVVAGSEVRNEWMRAVQERLPVW